MQGSIEIQDGSGDEVLEQLNAAFEAVATDFCDGTAPTTTYAGQTWLDTSDTYPVLKKRDQTNTEWVTLGTFTDDGFQPINTAAIEELEENKADVDLSNLSDTGEAHFADPDLSNLSDTGADLIKCVTDRLYEGINLETKFADEIAEYDTVYDWLQARKTAGDYSGIHIGDYFYVSMDAGTVGSYSVSAQTFTCRIVGLDTYYNCGDTAIGHMIYCISDEVIDTAMVWNPNNNNNGTASEANPWLASAMYAYLNGVNNYTTSAYNSVAHGASASGKGVLQLLPSALQNVMVTKRNLLDSRYSSSGLLTGGTTWVWNDMGKLWLPNEYEVYGCAVRSNLCLTSGFWHPEAGLSIQFPWFANNCEHRIKTNSSGTRCSWWLSSPASYNTTHVCRVNDYGNASSITASNSSSCAPLCFCI